LGGKSATLGPGVYQLQVGVRYQIRVHVKPGNAPYTTAGVEPNPQLATPASANLHNGLNTSVKLDGERDFFFTITPSAMGIYRVGFRLHDQTVAFNPAPPLEIHAVSLQSGLFGFVSSHVTRKRIPGATVKLGTSSTTTDQYGKYQLPLPAGQPPNLVVSMAGYSQTVAIHLPSPAGGLRVDVPLEDDFPLSQTGISYLGYLDYSHGRTLLHLVQVDSSLAEVHVEVPPHGRQ
jgi:hypothetical protein